MKPATLVCFVTVLVLSGCDAARQCKSRTAALHQRIEALDPSTALFSDSFPYEQVPSAPGAPAPGRLAGVPVLVLDPTHYEFDLEPKVGDEPLALWAVQQIRRYWGLLAKDLDPNEPLYIVATNRTPLSMLRTIREALRSIVVMRFGVRPLGPIPLEWKPSSTMRAAFENAWQGTKQERLDQRDRLFAFSLSAAEGCPEATAVVNYDGMYEEDRLRRLPTAFEQCDCNGDMDTLAAYYVRSTLENHKPIRWYPWDDALVERLGEHGTYGDLVRVLAEKPAP